MNHEFHPLTTSAVYKYKMPLKTPLVGAFQAISDPIVTEHYGKLGFGAVIIDQQHSLMDERTAFECVQRLEKFPSCFPIVRVCDNTPALISRALDAGASGIMAPMINNVEDAKKLVRQCRYPPHGVRSFRPTRALVLGSQPEEINSFVKVFAMIETAEAIMNLEDILNVEGLDGVFVGPSDLSVSLGVRPIANLQHPDMVYATKKVLEECKSRGKVAMIMTGNKEMAQQKLAEGWDGVFQGCDMLWLIKAAREHQDFYTSNFSNEK